MSIRFVLYLYINDFWFYLGPIIFLLCFQFMTFSLGPVPCLAPIAATMVVNGQVCFPQYFGITRIYINFIFLRKKNTNFLAVFLLFTASVRSRPPGPPAVPGVFLLKLSIGYFSAFYGQHSVVEAWKGTDPSPLSICG